VPDDFIAAWWDRNKFDVYLAIVTWACVALYFVIATTGRKPDGR
jgi:hypothetical protein